MRIFPEMCVRTLCPLSNSTRNMALGRGSTTVPSTSIASFFAKFPDYLTHAKNTPRFLQERTLSIGVCRRTVYRAKPPARRSSSRAGGENFGAVFGDGDGVLEVRRETLVGGHDGPPVGQETCPPVAHVDHGFDRHHQAGPDQRAPARFAVVRDLWVLVERPAHAVPRVLPDAAEASAFDHLLNGVAHVRQPSSRLE